MYFQMVIVFKMGKGMVAMGIMLRNVGEHLNLKHSATSTEAIAA